MGSMGLIDGFPERIVHLLCQYTTEKKTKKNTVDVIYSWNWRTSAKDVLKISARNNTMK